MRYGVGLVIGMVVGIGLGAAFLMILFKKKVLDMHFDERQERARGEAFKYGFFTLVACGMAFGCVDIMYHWCDFMAGTTLCVCIGVVVFAVTAICKDAYLGLYEKPAKIMVLFGILGIANLGLGLNRLMEGNIVENGILTFRATNLMVGGMVLAILTVYGIRYLFRRAAEDNDEWTF